MRWHELSPSTEPFRRTDACKRTGSLDAGYSENAAALVGPDQRPLNSRGSPAGPAFFQANPRTAVRRTSVVISPCHSACKTIRGTRRKKRRTVLINGILSQVRVSRHVRPRTSESGVQGSVLPHRERTMPPSRHWLKKKTTPGQAAGARQAAFDGRPETRDDGEKLLGHGMGNPGTLPLP